jgi:uncharacterized repeat protein (TIGR01451 family)
LKAFFGILLIFVSMLPATGAAIPPPPTPGDQMLFIYVNRPFNVGLVNNIKAALAALPSPPTITDLVIQPGSRNGFNDELTAAGYMLNNYCQVWDLRFHELNNGVAFSGTIQEDTITTAGANNDSLLLRNFMQQGGHLFVMGENDGFFARNEGLMQFIADATGAPISYPSNAPSWNITTIDNSAPEFFRTAFDTLTTPFSLSTYPGQVPLAGIGSGQPLSRDANFTLDLLWQAGSLTSGNGKLMVTFDSNLFAVPDLQYDKYARNTYTTMASCYNFTVTKAASASQVCAGDPFSYTICWQNTGTRDIPATVISDTLPNCVAYVSASVAPSGSSGQLRWWNVGPIAPGPQQCLTINVTAQFCP